MEEQIFQSRDLLRLPSVVYSLTIPVLDYCIDLKSEFIRQTVLRWEST